MTNEPQQKIGIPLIGLLAVKNKLVTQSELKDGMTQTGGAEDVEAALKDYFLARELISKKNIQRLSLAVKAITIRQKEYKFGAIAVAKGFINKSVTELALEDQQEDIKKGRKPRLIGDMMVDAGLLTEQQRDHILKLQKRVKKTVSPKRVSNHTPPSNSRGTKATFETEKKNTDGSKVSEFLPPEIITGGIQLQISGDFMGAFLTKTDGFDDMVSVSDILIDLSDRGIVAGVLAEEMIQGFIGSSGFKTQAFRVAKGILPIQGQDAKVEFFFNTDYLKAGGMDDDGNIDFKERGEIPLVEKGTVLAEKTPRVKARQGKNIYGEPVAAQEGRDTAMKFGAGAVLSEDGFKLLAGVRGYPKYSLGGLVFVHREYTTGGNVDFETGHIEFDGNVIIKGCIKTGFKVRGNDIFTKELDGGLVEADGDLKVAGGINEGKIYARGNVYARFIHKSEIVCMGDVYVEKEIVDSTIESSGACLIINGKLISSKISAKMGLTVRNIGTEMASPSVITVGHDAFTAKELQKNKENIAGIKEKILKLAQKKSDAEAISSTLQKEITKLAHTQDRSQIELRQVQQELDDQINPPSSNTGSGDSNQRMSGLKVAAQEAELKLNQCFEKSDTLETVIKKVDRDIAALNQQVDNLDEERRNLNRWSKENSGKARVIVEGAVLSGNTIIGKHSELIVEEEVRHTRITEVLFRSDEGGTERTFYQMKVNPY